MEHMEVPFLDLVTPHAALEEELVSRFRRALRSAAFIGGTAVVDFEQAFAAACETAHCVGVGSGTDALRFALIAAGVRPGDSVVTVANTFIATTEAISQAGAVPEFVDVDERTYNLDPEKLRTHFAQACRRDPVSGRPVSRRSGRIITAVVPVHLYGQMADMDPILELAEHYNLLVVEDACQAHGAQYFSRREQRWRTAGSMGKAAAFSFYPGKNLGACGEAGAVTTNDPQLAATVSQLRDHGQAAKYYHDVEGYNGRLDAIQAAFLHAKLPYLSQWNEQRRRVAKAYGQELAGIEGLMTPWEPSWSRAVYHLYVVRVPDRANLQERLKAEGIGTGIHYPVPLHEQKAYGSVGYRKGDLPITERVAPEVVSLPMYPHLSGPQRAKVVGALTARMAACSTAR